MEREYARALRKLVARWNSFFSVDDDLCGYMVMVMSYAVPMLLFIKMRIHKKQILEIHIAQS